MGNYLKKLEKITMEVESLPFIEIVQNEIRPPAEDRIFDRIESAYGIQLDDEIKNFYSELNGFYFHWRIKDDIRNIEKIQNKYDDYWIEYPENEDNPFAKINLLPIEEVFFDTDWINKFHWHEFDKKSQVDFKGKPYNRRDFSKFLKPFDLFSSFSFMSFLIDPASQELDVLMLTGHGAEWDNSRITDFETYIGSLFNTYGITEARETIFSEYRGDLMPELTSADIDWAEVRPKLFL